MSRTISLLIGEDFALHTAEFNKAVNKGQLMSSSIMGCYYLSCQFFCVDKRWPTL